jgi:hypothetical protein
LRDYVESTYEVERKSAFSSPARAALGIHSRQVRKTREAADEANRPLQRAREQIEQAEAAHLAAESALSAIDAKESAALQKLLSAGTWPAPTPTAEQRKARSEAEALVSAFCGNPGAVSLILGCSGSPSTSNKIIQKRTGFFAQTERYCVQFGALAALRDPAPPACSLRWGPAEDHPILRLMPTGWNLRQGQRPTGRARRRLKLWMSFYGFRD